MSGPLASLLISFPIFITAIVVHEFAHGWIAYKLGDPTAKYSGRLTLNPLAHIDPVGTVILPLLLAILHSPVIFGWARPVPINFLGLRHPKRDMLWVGLAGPLANFIFAFLLALPLNYLPAAHNGVFSELAAALVLVNLVLAVCNLIPIPPLDGSRILFSILPLKLALRYIRLESYGFLIIFALLYLGFLNRVVLPTASFLARLMGI